MNITALLDCHSHPDIFPHHLRSILPLRNADSHCGNNLKFCAFSLFRAIAKLWHINAGRAIFAQFTYCESLRDIEACLGTLQSNLYHMGFAAVCAPTPADTTTRASAPIWRAYCLPSHSSSTPRNR